MKPEHFGDGPSQVGSGPGIDRGTFVGDRHSKITPAVGFRSPSSHLGDMARQIAEMPGLPPVGWVAAWDPGFRSEPGQP
jgi:hypothetical protein